MKKELYVSLLTAGTLVMSGCGSSSSDGSTTPTGDNTPTTLTSQFIDSPVQGLSYDCQSSGKTGVTDSEGTFNYVAGDTCTFKVGTVTLGSAKPTGPVFTPKELSADPVEVTNMLRFLQTLDTDGDATNGITLPADINGSVNFGLDFDAEINTFLANNNVSNAVVTADDANAHFEETLAVVDLAGDVDTSVTTKSILTESGNFVVYGWVDYNGTDYFSQAYMGKSLLVDGVFQYYDYNATSDAFELYTGYSSGIEIRLVNGVWVSKTYAQWDALASLTFNANNDFVWEEGGSSITYSATAYNAAGKSIAPLYDESSNLGGVSLPSDALFSEGAKVYKFTSTTANFQPSYNIDYWTNQTCDSNGVCTEIPGNSNYQSYWDSTSSSEVMYTDITKFINDKTFSATNDPATGYGTNSIYFWTEDKSYIGLFSSNNTIVLYNNNWDQATQTYDNSKLSVEGSYEVKTVDGVEILVLDVPDTVASKWMIEENNKIIYAVQDGALREGHYNYAPATSGFTEYNEVAARDIYNLILAQSTTQPSLATGAPARASTVQVLDPIAEKSKQQWLKKEATRNAHRGF